MRVCEPREVKRAGLQPLFHVANGDAATAAVFAACIRSARSDFLFVPKCSDVPANSKQARWTWKTVILEPRRALTQTTRRRRMRKGKNTPSLITQNVTKRRRQDQRVNGARPPEPGSTGPAASARPGERF